MRSLAARNGALETPPPPAPQPDGPAPGDPAVPPIEA